MSTVPRELAVKILPDVLGLISCQVHQESIHQKAVFVKDKSQLELLGMLFMMSSMLAGEMEHSAQHHGTDPATELQDLIIKINNRFPGRD